MRYLLITFLLIGISSQALAYEFQPQKEIVCLGGQRAGQSSCVTPTLAVAQDAHTDCDASTDGVVTLETSALDCANSGSMLVSSFNQISVEVHYTRASGTAVKMQCDESKDGLAPWAVRTKIDSEGTSTIRTWTHTQSFSGAIKWNWDINTKYLRCRFWIVGGTASDKIQAFFRLASEVKQ